MSWVSSICKMRKFSCTFMRFYECWWNNIPGIEKCVFISSMVQTGPALNTKVKKIRSQTLDNEMTGRHLVRDQTFLSISWMLKASMVAGLYRCPQTTSSLLYTQVTSHISRGAIESKLNLWLALTNKMLWKQCWLVPGLSFQKACHLLLLCCWEVWVAMWPFEEFTWRDKGRGQMKRTTRRRTQDPTSRSQQGPRHLTQLSQRRSPVPFEQPCEVPALWVKTPTWMLQPSQHHVEQRRAVSAVPV